MHPATTTSELDQTVLTTLRDKIANFVERADPDLAKASLRVADITVDRQQREAYSTALRDVLCPMFRERLYYVSVAEYFGRNGRKFVDVQIDMKRGLAI